MQTISKSFLNYQKDVLGTFKTFEFFHNSIYDIH